MVSFLAIAGGRSIWAHQAVSDGYFMKPHENNLPLFPLAPISAHRRLSRFSHQFYVCKSEAFEAAALSPIEISKPDNNYSDNNLIKSRSLISAERAVALLNKKNRKNSSENTACLALTQVRKLDSQGNYSSLVSYLINLGMQIEELEGIIRKYPSFVKYECNIKPFVDFLSNSGVNPLDVPKIILKFPRLIRTGSVENVKSLIYYLEDIGLDKEQIAKVVTKYPSLFSCTKLNIEMTVHYLRELGLSNESLIKTLTRAPLILSLSLDNNLIPTIDYFEYIGINVTALIRKVPEVLCLNSERKLKRVIEFFLERGFSNEEVFIMINRYLQILTLSVEKNLVQKWEYFVYMDYSRDEIVKCPLYFGCSLEKRIKPRFEMMVECGLKFPLNVFLITANVKFEKLLERKSEEREKNVILKFRNLKKN